MALSSFLKPHTDRQVHNKDKHVANIAARRSGLTPPAPEVAPPAPGPEVNAGVRLGGMVREKLVPAAGAVGAGIANAASIVPRSFAHVGKNIMAGMRGEPGSNEFDPMPVSNPFPANQAASPPAATPPPRLGGNSAMAATAPQPAAPAPTGLAADRAADAMLYGDQAKIVGGNSPQAAAALPPPPPRLRPTVDMVPGGWMRNEQTGEVLTVGANRGARIGAFDAAGNPIDKITPLRLGGRSAGGGSNYSFAGSPEAAQRFNSAVSPGEYSPEAEAARGKAREQFLGRQGYTKLTPIEQMVGRPLNSFDAKQQPEIIKAALGGMAAKDANEVARMTATGQAAESRVGLKMKENSLAAQEKTSKLMEEYPTATPERRAAIENEMVMMGAKQPRAEKEPKVYFQKTYDDMGKVSGEEPFLYDESTGEARPLRLGGDSSPQPPPRDPKDRKAGVRYSSPSGPVVWDGKGFVRG